MEFKCKFQSRNWLNGDKYTCEVISAITKPGSNVAVFDGIHKGDLTGDDVEGLVIENIALECFPKGISKTFPKLKNLWIMKSGLKVIQRTDLAPFTKLEFLALPKNNLERLQDDLLQNMSKLRWIFLNDNLIEFMSSKLLEPIKDNDLERISFNKNASINFFFKKGTKNTLEHLMAVIDRKCKSSPAEGFTSINKSSSALLEMFETGCYSDFTIKVHDKEYKVHKVVLAAQSAVFKSMFSNALSLENEDMGHKEAKAFEDFLEYFYTGSVKSNDNAVDLLEFATKFEVHNLKTICEKILLEALHESNLLDVYNIGCDYSSNVLKLAAFSGIQKLIPELKDKAIDEIDLVNDLMNAKQRLGKLLEIAQKY